MKVRYYIHMIDPKNIQDTSLIHRPTESKLSPNIGHFLIGRPLQTIGKAVGLAVFASDALSSTAYATQEILVIPAAAGSCYPELLFGEDGTNREALAQRDTGLGLAIVKSIAERHGGKVWVESELVKGSTFHLQVPLEQSKESQPAQ